MTDTSYYEASQATGGEAVIMLFQLDLSPLGDSTVIFFSKEMQDPRLAQQEGLTNGCAPSFMGVTYTPLECDASGFEWTTLGSLPQPKISISLVTALISGLLMEYDNLVGAKINRLRTYYRFLDGGPDAAAAPYSYQMDSFRIEQKSAHDKFHVEFTLSSAIDQQGRQLPPRLVVKDTCQWRYRIWNANTSAFDYTFATCPYNGTACFDANGYPTTEDSDQCSFQIATGCNLRYPTISGQPAPTLPFGGFPGTTRNQ